jgi:hypothetical protein
MQHRNEPCACGSGLRHKYCCGGARTEELIPAGYGPDDKTLLNIVLEEDEVGLKAGEAPKARSLKTLLRAVGRISPGGGNIIAGHGKPIFVERINKIIERLYRPADIGMGSLHVGAIMFRDIFARVDIPIGWGRFSLNPLECSDLTQTQKDWIRSRPEDYLLFCDQFLDLADFAYGLTDIVKTTLVCTEAQNLIQLSHTQLEAAAATVTGHCDLRGAIQCALLGAELVMKAGLACKGINEVDRKRKFRHNHYDMANYLTDLYPRLDRDRITRVAKSFPEFVPNRYSAFQPGRIETGHILMGAQYIASEVVRELSGRSVRVSAKVGEPRVYPA